MHSLLQNLSAFIMYEVFVQAVVFNDEDRLSNHIKIRLSESSMSIKALIYFTDCLLVGSDLEKHWSIKLLQHVG